MPALNVEFSDDELVLVPATAADSGMSMRVFCRQAILGKARNRADRIHAVAEEAAARSAELNRRLA